MTGFRQVKVVRKTMEAQDIALFELADAAGADLPPFRAGAHIDVEIRPGLIRQYSLCNDPAERSRYLIGVLLERTGRGGSAALHDVCEGEALLVSEPRNHFQLEGSAERSLLFAGGIGVTPILCMAQQLAAVGAEFEMHYAARSPARAGFRDRIAASAFAGRVRFHFDDGDAEQMLDLDAALGAVDPRTHLYVCGPEGFIDLVLSAARAKGYAEAQLHREYFKVDTSQMFAAGGPFQIMLASSGRVLSVPADQTVLEVLRQSGAPAPASCQQGVCGTCLTRVLEGAPDHRDHYLTEAERAANDQFLPCCSRSRSPLLVLDL